ncbi:MAG: DUF664 domain-containing protein [Gemmatimonadota bacterium]
MKTTTSVISALLQREIKGMQAEVAAYPDDQAVWRLLPGWSNSAGTLVLHTAGNLRHYIGEVLGKDGYVRDREAEFASRGLSRQELDEELQLALEAVARALEALGGHRGDMPDPLTLPYPLELPGGRRLSTGGMLLHLLSHAAYHLGQVDFHRRAITGMGETVGTVALGDVPDL